jgi:hypothetical protein
MKTTLLYVFCTLFLIALIPMCLAGDFACSWLSEGAAVAREELGPRALLKKYEEFKDMHAMLAKKQADIKILAQGLADWDELYDVPRGQWPRDERQQYAQDKQALAGLKLSFNALAAQYNARMAKINYQFCNIGELPAGATEVLPREYAAYATQ